jgi:hypothetical protein
VTEADEERLANLLARAAMAVVEAARRYSEATREGAEYAVRGGLLRELIESLAAFDAAKAGETEGDGNG